MLLQFKYTTWYKDINKVWDFGYITRTSVVNAIIHGSSTWRKSRCSRRKMGIKQGERCLIQDCSVCDNIFNAKLLLYRN